MDRGKKRHLSDRRYGPKIVPWCGARIGDNAANHKDEHSLHFYGARYCHDAPTATGTGAEVQRPFATVVIGGLLIGMVLSMLALPAMLLIAARREALEPEQEEDDSFEDAPPSLPGAGHDPHGAHAHGE